MSTDIYAIKVPIKAVYDDQHYWLQNPSNVREVYDINLCFYEFGPNYREGNAVLCSVIARLRDAATYAEGEDRYDCPQRIKLGDLPEIQSSTKNCDEYNADHFTKFVKDCEKYMSESTVEELNEAIKRYEADIERYGAILNRELPKYEKSGEPPAELVEVCDKYNAAVDNAYTAREKREAGGYFAIYLQHR